MQNKTTLIAVFIAFASGIALGLFLQVTGSPTKKDTASTTKEEKPTNKIEYTFSGEGKQTLGPIALEDGLAVVRAKNLTGKNNSFKVEVFRDENNDKKLQENEGWTGLGIEVIYEEAENYNGAFALKANKGNYFIYVDGGRWEVAVIQPNKLKKNTAKMKRFEENSDTVTNKFFLNEGVHKFRATYSGEGNFIIKIYDEDGNATRHLVNEIGNTDLVFEYKNIFDGNYVFEVNAFGPWSIEAK